MKENTARQSEANRARIRRLRAQYHRRLVAAIIICFILGCVAGAFGYRWYASRTPRDVVDVTAQVTPQPTEQATPEPDADAPGLFIEGEEPVDDTAVQDAFPEVEAQETEAAGDDIFPEDTPEPEAEAAPEAETEAQADLSSDEVAEYDPAQAQVPEEYLAIEDENGEAEAKPEAVESSDATAEAGTEEAATDTAEAETDAAEAEAAPEAEPAAPEGPQVVAIVPYGESFTYSTQIDANGNARVEAGDEPYETVSFTQTMKGLMRPTDFADQYSKTYKLEGTEAGASFELILNDYTGAATIVPQNVIDISLRSESGNTTERGYQLMDAPIDGNYGIAVTTNTPKLLYKRYPYSDVEEMAYLVVTTYNDGVSQMILFQLESDEPEPEPEVVYPILQQGITGEEVVNLQNRLIQLGYLTGTADGTFGAMTEEAIRKAQAAFGLTVNGIADNTFQHRLYDGADAEPTAADYQTLNESSTGEAVVALQLRLRELGYYEGKADGGYGPMTVAAVKRAQEAFGMEATGIADPAFLAQVYAGADATAEPTPEAEPTPDPSVAGENTVG